MTDTKVRDMTRDPFGEDDRAAARVADAISVLGPEVIEGLRVEAKNGVVTLAGVADRRSTRKLAVRIASRTPGVLRVVDDMTHEIHDRAPRVPAASDVLAPAA